jgi:hypothetical protein
MVPNGRTLFCGGDLQWCVAEPRSLPLAPKHDTAYGVFGDRIHGTEAMTLPLAPKHGRAYGLVTESMVQRRGPYP